MKPLSNPLSRHDTPFEGESAMKPLPTGTLAGQGQAHAADRLCPADSDDGSDGMDSSSARCEALNGLTTYTEEAIRAVEMEKQYRLLEQQLQQHQQYQQQRQRQQQRQVDAGDCNPSYHATDDVCDSHSYEVDEDGRESCGLRYVTVSALIAGIATGPS